MHNAAAVTADLHWQQLDLGLSAALILQFSRLVLVSFLVTQTWFVAVCTYMSHVVWSVQVDPPAGSFCTLYSECVQVPHSLPAQYMQQLAHLNLQPSDMSLPYSSTSVQTKFCCLAMTYAGCIAEVLQSLRQ
jgi:hypothetical protein